jgi:hypothetical protein
MAAAKEAQVQFMDVSPEMAQRWLSEANTDNRNISQRQVERIARDIRAKAYPVTHEGIGFDLNGKLIDGQHRLAAIALAKLPVTLAVARNLPVESGFFIDQGRTRNFADVAKLRCGKPVSNRVGAVARAMADPMMKCNTSRFEHVCFYQEHSEVIHKALDMFKGCSPELCPSHVVAVVARALFHIDEAIVKRFVDALKDPIDFGVKASDRAAVVLREELIRKADAKPDRRTVYRRTQYLLNAFVNRNSRPSRYEKASVELFPIPKIEKAGKIKFDA